MASRRYQSEGAQGPGNALDTSRSQATQQLSATLSNFRRQMTSVSQAIFTEKGTRAGQQAEGTPQLKSRFTAYGRAYNNAALRNYVISQHGAMEAEMARVEIDAKTPAEFQELAVGLRRGAVKSAIPEARGDLAELYNRRIAEGFTRVTERARQEEKKTNRAMLQQGLEQVSASITRKLNTGNPLLMAEAEEDEVHYGLMIDGAINSGDITPAEAIALRNDGLKRVTRNIITGAFEQQLREGDPIDFIGKVMQQPVTNLSDEEKQVMVGELFQRLNQNQALESEAAAMEVAGQKARWAKGERTATVRALRGELSVGEIARMVEDDDLSPSDGRTLESMISAPRAKGEDDKKLKFSVETNLLRYSEKDIAGMDGLTYDTRAELIEERRKQTQSWRSDQGAEEALRRIDQQLKIPSGLGPQFQVAISPEQALAAARARSAFYDLVEATPEAERRSKYFELADKAIGHVAREVKAVDLSKQEKLLNDYIKSAGDPNEMSARKRAEYDATVKRRTDAINRLRAEAK